MRLRISPESCGPVLCPQPSPSSLAAAPQICHSRATWHAGYDFTLVTASTPGRAGVSLWLGLWDSLLGSQTRNQQSTVKMELPKDHLNNWTAAPRAGSAAPVLEGSSLEGTTILFPALYTLTLRRKQKRLVETQSTLIITMENQTKLKLQI